MYNMLINSTCPQATLDLDGDRLVSRGEVMEVFQQLGSTGSKIMGLQVSGQGRWRCCRLLRLRPCGCVAA